MSGSARGVDLVSSPRQGFANRANRHDSVLPTAPRVRPKQSMSVKILGLDGSGASRLRWLRWSPPREHAGAWPARRSRPRRRGPPRSSPPVALPARTHRTRRKTTTPIASGSVAATWTAPPSVSFAVAAASAGNSAGKLARAPRLHRGGFGGHDLPLPVQPEVLDFERRMQFLHNQFAIFGSIGPALAGGIASREMVQAVANVVMFLPVGILVPILCGPRRVPARTLVVAVTAAVLIEATQYAISSSLGFTYKRHRCRRHHPECRRRRERFLSFPCS